MKDFLKDFLKQDETIAIYGVSDISQNFVEALNCYRGDVIIKYFIDSTKQGVFWNVPIIALNKISSDDKNLTYVVLSNSHGDILEQNLKDAKISNIKRLPKEIFSKLKTMHQNDRYPCGHYYSAIPSDEDIKTFLTNRDEDRLSFLGIDLNIEKQLENLEYFNSIYDSFNFPYEKEKDKFYYWNNVWFYHYDAYCYASLIRKFKPKRIMEIGSGYSTGLALDINKEFFNNKIEITSIEPNPQRLKKVLCKEKDLKPEGGVLKI